MNISSKILPTIKILKLQMCFDYFFYVNLYEINSISKVDMWNCNLAPNDLVFLQG